MRVGLWEGLPNGAREAFPRLRPIPIGELKIRACRELARMGDAARDEAPVLVEALADPALDVRLEILRALEALGGAPKAARATLLGIMRDPALRGLPLGTALREKASWLLARMDPDDPEIVASVTEFRDQMRTEAATGATPGDDGVDSTLHLRPRTSGTWLGE